MFQAIVTLITIPYEPAGDWKTPDSTIPRYFFASEDVDTEEF